MTYPSSHIAIPISHSAHIAPTISVIGRAFSIQNFLPLTSGLQPQRTLNTPPSACGRKLGTFSSRPRKLSPRRTRGQPVRGTCPAGRSFIGRGEPR